MIIKFRVNFIRIFQKHKKSKLLRRNPDLRIVCDLCWKFLFVHDILLWKLLAFRCQHLLERQTIVRKERGMGCLQIRKLHTFPKGFSFTISQRCSTRSCYLGYRLYRINVKHLRSFNISYHFWSFMIIFICCVNESKVIFEQ